MPKVKIYSTPTCSYCYIIKDFFKKNKIKFEDIDVSKNKKGADEMVEKSGQISVPVVDIDGEIIIGYEMEKIKKALNL